jgi:small subunit ribosomal protein S14
LLVKNERTRNANFETLVSNFFSKNSYSKNKKTPMAKKSMIERERKRQFLVQKYKTVRESIKKEIKETFSLEEKLVLHRKLQGFPRNSSPVRLHNRCSLSGRPKGYFRDFGISRHVLREMAHECLLPGVTKSSW